jgi:gamma-glutamyltranspeptidase / glutathione hydrolase
MRMSVSFRKILLLFFIVLSFVNIYLYAGNPVRAKHGMVVSANNLASDVGIQILKKGGNAVDASVAVGFALAVTFPYAGNIGGGGFMVIHLADRRNTTIDFRETAPLAVNEKMFLDKNGNFIPVLSQEGWTSSGVPGTVAGLIYALEKYGTLPLKDVIQPAIDLAENGFILSFSNKETNDYYLKFLNKAESTKKIFTKNGNKFEEGDLLIQKDLAKTLSIIRDNGKDGFYKGEIAKRFLAESNKHGGLFTKKDLEDYTIIERKPIEGTYQGYKIISMPPPSSGGVCLIEALNVLENYSFKKENWNGSEYLHTLIELLKHVYADRAKHLGDPDFYNVPVDLLTSKEYSKNIKNEIEEKAVPSNLIKAIKIPHKEKDETTHYSVADQFGNAVSTTYTLNGAYGNNIVVEGLGFLLNNEMDDFSAKPGIPNQFGLIGSYANSIQPKKRMLSSMTPTIVLKNDKPYLVVGSPGGATIITSVLQVVLNVLTFDMNIYDAIAAPRIHHQWLPDEIEYEKYGISEDVKKNLIARGHKFGSEESLGRVEGIIYDSTTKTFLGTSDPRGFGKAEGF